MFNEMYDLIPEGGKIEMTLIRKNGKLTASILPKLPTEKITIPGKSTHMTDDVSLNDLKPLVLSGTPEEFNTEFAKAIMDYTPAVQGFQSNIEEAKATFEEKMNKLKEKEEKMKAKNKKTAPAAAPDRKKGEAKENEAKTLSSIDSKDGIFKATLKKANMPTLDMALKNEITVPNAKAIAKEMVKIDSTLSVEGILTPIWTDKYKTAENGTKKQLGEELVKVSGKSLEDLGLAAKPLSLI